MRKRRYKHNFEIPMGRQKIFLSKKKNVFFSIFFQIDFSALSRRKSEKVVSVAHLALDLIFHLQKTPCRNSNHRTKESLRRKSCWAIFGVFFRFLVDIKKTRCVFCLELSEYAFWVTTSLKTTFFFTKKHT